MVQIGEHDIQVPRVLVKFLSECKLHILLCKCLKTGEVCLKKMLNVINFSILAASFCARLPQGARKELCSNKVSMSPQNTVTDTTTSTLGIIFVS